MNVAVGRMGMDVLLGRGYTAEYHGVRQLSGTNFCGIVSKV